MPANRSYPFYREIFKDEQMPLAFLDLDLLNENIQSILNRAGSKKMRIASKSIRCRYAMEHILGSSNQFQGIMSYTAGEAVWLTDQGFDDILVGYPCMSGAELNKVVDKIAQGKKIIPMIDDLAQATLLNDLAKEKNVVVKICLDIDMSTDFPGLHFGVYRSPLHHIEDVRILVDKLQPLSHISIHGIMGYEAQVAGIGDNVDGEGLKNAAVRLLKRNSHNDYKKRRGEIVEWLNLNGHHVELVNAGGTGSIEWSAGESSVTEVTVGSGFFAPGLFDHYSGFHHLPALGFALQIVREPKEDYFTCLGGGYIASGVVGKLKQPYPYLPEGVEPVANEGFGEVQTPFHYKGNDDLKVGDPVFFRHAKAGELCEHFNEIQVVKDGKVVEKVKTYRGDGQVFL